MARVSIAGLLKLARSGEGIKRVGPDGLQQNDARLGGEIINHSDQAGVQQFCDRVKWVTVLLGGGMGSREVAAAVEDANRRKKRWDRSSSRS